MAFTTVPAAGAKLRGSTLSALITETRPIAARLTSNFSLATGTTVLANVTGLVVTGLVNQLYEVRVELGVDNVVGTTEDVKVGFSFPSGAGLALGSVGGTPAGVTAGASTDMSIVQQVVTSGSTAYTFGAATGNTTILFEGIYSMGATPGSLQVMAAQNTSGANASRILQQSLIVIQQIA